ncbi:hypothetical protein TNCV_2769911 [Trichonephila clavipes]|nr:hypothetical protein TNCV_2769911 [Trichonephila clavipes]
MTIDKSNEEKLMDKDKPLEQCEELMNKYPGEEISNDPLDSMVKSNEPLKSKPLESELMDKYNEILEPESMDKSNETLEMELMDKSNDTANETLEPMNKYNENWDGERWWYINP